jgi:hypothetical protein
LKLAADAIATNAFDHSPTIAALACNGFAQTPAQVAAVTTLDASAAMGSC